MMRNILNELNDFWRNMIGKISTIIVGVLLISFIITILVNLVNSDQLANAKSDKQALSIENGEIKEELEQTVNDLEESQSELEKVQNELDGVKEEYEVYKAEMTVYEEMEEAEAENRTHKAEVEKEEREKAEAAKEAEEEEERKKAEEEAAEKKKKEEEEKERQGYETGITFEDLARTPDQFEGEKVKFSGKVIQVMEGDTYSQIRLAVDDNYDQVIYIEVSENLLSEGRILEDDYITIMGVSIGLLDYESAIGSQITVPAVIVDEFERQ